MSEINNPIPNYNFMVRVNGAIDIPCKNVQGFSNEYEYEYIKEGGINDYVHVKRKPVEKPNIVKIERYVYDDNPIDLLAGGRRMVAPMLLFVSKYPGEFSNPKIIYTFTGCTVLKVEYGELSAENGKLLTEVLTIAYESVTSVNNPLASEKKEWKFDGKKVEGKGKMYARKVTDYGVPKQADSKTSRKWPTTSSRNDIKKYL